MYSSFYIPFMQEKFALHQVKMHYTQTDTMRQTDGPLVPMVGLVPIQKDVIPMVLLVNMHALRGLRLFSPVT